MARDISISISAKDDFSKVFKTIMDTNKAFDKDLTGVSKKLEQLNKTKYSLKLDVEKSKAELEELKKKALETKEEIDKTNYVNKATQHAALERNFDLVSNSVKEVEKAFHNLTLATQPEELFKALGSKGLTKMVGTAVQNYTTTYLNSALGSENGTMLTNILSSAVSGAAMGAPLGPHGIVAGAVIGGVAGAISGSTENFKKEDEAFKKYYQNQYNSILDERKRTLESGLSIASTREQDIKTIAVTLKKIQAAKNITMESIKPLLDRNIPVWEYLEGNIGKTKEEIVEMINQGAISGEEVAKVIAEAMDMDPDNIMNQQTYVELLTGIKDLQNGIDSTMGEGYMTERMKGIQDQNEFLSGEAGIKLKEINRRIGQWQAFNDNLAEQYERDALTALMTGEVSSIFSEDGKKRLTKLYKEFVTLYEDPSIESALKLDALIGEVKAIGQNEYNASDTAQNALKSSLDLADRIKNNAGLNDSYWDADYEKSIQLSKGLGNVSLNNFQIPSRDSGYLLYKDWRKDIPTSGADVSLNKFQIPSHDSGYLLYKNWRENIPTSGARKNSSAGENQTYNNNASVTVTGNTFVVREEADISKIALEIVKEFSKASFSLQTQLMA